MIRYTNIPRPPATPTSPAQNLGVATPQSPRIDAYGQGYWYHAPICEREHTDWGSLQKLTYFRYLIHELARSMNGDLSWHCVHSNGRAVAQDLARKVSRPYGRYVKSQHLLLMGRPKRAYGSANQAFSFSNTRRAKNDPCHIT